MKLGEVALRCFCSLPRRRRKKQPWDQPSGGQSTWAYHRQHHHHQPGSPSSPLWLGLSSLSCSSSLETSSCWCDYLIYPSISFRFTLKFQSLLWLVYTYWSDCEMLGSFLFLPEKVALSSFCAGGGRSGLGGSRQSILVIIFRSLRCSVPSQFPQLPWMSMSLVFILFLII